MQKYFGFKMLIYSLFGIQVMNLGIIIGSCNFLINKLILRK